MTFFFDTGRLDELSWRTWSQLTNTYLDHLEELELKWLLCSAGNIAYSKDLLEEIGLFDQSFTGYGLEDLECGYRANLIGANFTFDMEAEACHQYHSRNRFKQLVSTYKNWKYFINKHNTDEVWLWLAWRMLGEFEIEEYNNLISGCKSGDTNAIRKVKKIKESLEKLTLSKFIRLRKQYLSNNVC